MSENSFRIIKSTNKTDRKFYADFVHNNFLCADGEAIFSMLSYDKKSHSLPFSGALLTANAFMPFDESESDEKFVLLLEGPGNAITQQPTKNLSSPKIAPSSSLIKDNNSELKALLLGMVFTVGKCNDLIVTGKNKDTELGEIWRLSDKNCSVFCGVMFYGMDSEGKNSSRKPADWPLPQFDNFTLFVEISEECGQRAFFKELVDQGKSNEKVMYIKVQATSKSHTRQGLGYKIAEECVRIAKEDPDIKHVVVEATGVGTRRIYEKLGFELQHKIDYKEKIGTFFEDNEYNRNVADLHESCNFYYLAL